MMKKIFTIVCGVMLSMCTYAQQNLTGRVYHCGNLLEKELNEVKKEASDMEKEAVDKEEKEEIKGVNAITDAIEAKMTLTFISEKTVEMDVEYGFDEEKAKKGGASWMLRKLVKMKIGKGKSRKGETTYTVDGRKIIVKNQSKKGKTQTFELSEDGKSMSVMLNDRKVILKRIK